MGEMFKMSFYFHLCRLQKIPYFLALEKRIGEIQGNLVITEFF